MQITKKLIVAGAGVLALVAGGSAAYAATSAGDTAAPTALTSPLTSAAAPTAPKVTAEQAIDIAKQAVPGAWVSEVDFDGRGSRADVWEVELVKGAQRHEVDVDAASGKIVKQEIDDDRHSRHDGRDDDRHGDDRHGDDD
ncbi:peptidase [Nonomuraea sp. MG754425]|uniref:PepSY domain-containing protein n=1 Tax=Nonomuraea sp. MG754425 TaxID=2570319 RepID=UPI001F1FC30D|nr:PepSY domain-containing protein [Nonomuraea sp. MG754425]MCF6469522.1 peptidase [Nonomuraea sp. MG754425]